MAGEEIKQYLQGLYKGLIYGSKVGEPSDVNLYKCFMAEILDHIEKTESDNENRRQR